MAVIDDFQPKDEEDDAVDPVELIQNRTLDIIEDDLVRWGKQNGYIPDTMRNLLDQVEQDIRDDIRVNLDRADENTLGIANLIRANAEDFSDDDLTGFKASDYSNFRGTTGWYSTPEGIEQLIDNGWTTLRTRWNGLTDRVAGTGGGTGRRKPTATEIRNRYDLDQLTGNVNDIWRLLVLEEHDNPRKLASDYVEAIVRTGAEKQIDFQTFVREKARATARYKSIYQSKPESMSEEQFLQPYFNVASNVLRPKNAAAAAIGGAQFGADAQTFQQRLARSNEAVTSAPFVNQIGERIAALRGVFKG